MTATQRATKNTLNLRLCLVCAVAATVGLSMAWISIGKFALFISALFLLTGRIINVSTSNKGFARHLPRYTTRAVLIVLAMFGISLLWTTAQTSESMGSLAKYGKLLTIVLLACMLKSRQEVLSALIAFVAAQALLVASSWMLYFGVPIPWATSQMAKTEFAVFSTYLDQGVMGATAAAVCWHLRSFAPGRFGSFIAASIALVCVINVLFVLSGRTGHLVAIALLSLAVMWELPRRLRWLISTLPLIFLLLFFAISQKVQNRIEVAKNEVKAFSIEQGANIKPSTSSGIRLHFWNRALQSIGENSIVGSGVGSWSNEFNRLEKQNNPKGLMVGERGNPHQEYLMWGVQLGVPGILLLLALMTSILKDTLSFDTQTAQATQSSLIALAVACLFNSSIYDAQIGDFFCVVIGLLLALGLHPQNPSHPAGQLFEENSKS